MFVLSGRRQQFILAGTALLPKPDMACLLFSNRLSWAAPNPLCWAEQDLSRSSLILNIFPSETDPTRPNWHLCLPPGLSSNNSCRPSSSGRSVGFWRLVTRGGELQSVIARRTKRGGLGETLLADQRGFVFCFYFGKISLLIHWFISPPGVGPDPSTWPGRDGREKKVGR